MAMAWTYPTKASFAGKGIAESIGTACNEIWLTRTELVAAQNGTPVPDKEPLAGRRRGSARAIVFSVRQALTSMANHTNWWMLSPLWRFNEPGVETVTPTGWDFGVDGDWLRYEEEPLEVGGSPANIVEYILHDLGYSSGWVPLPYSGYLPPASETLVEAIVQLQEVLGEWPHYVISSFQRSMHEPEHDGLDSNPVPDSVVAKLKIQEHTGDPPAPVYSKQNPYWEDCLAETSETYDVSETPALGSSLCWRQRLTYEDHRTVIASSGTWEHDFVEKDYGTLKHAIMNVNTNIPDGETAFHGFFSNWDWTTDWGVSGGYRFPGSAPVGNLLDSGIVTSYLDLDDTNSVTFTITTTPPSSIDSDVDNDANWRIQALPWVFFVHDVRPLLTLWQEPTP